MKKKLFGLFLISITLGVLGYVGYQGYKLSKEVTNLADPLAPAKIETEEKTKDNLPPSKFSKDKVTNILILGIDRRSKSETAFRTDIGILLSVNPAKKTVVMTSVPRDLWINGGRVNALYLLGGWESVQSAYYLISGQKPEAYVMSDFEDWKWLVDSIGGLDITLERSFTDNEYPNDVTKTYMTVAFQEGPQHINGTQALVLARSRHGNNGEGSDFSRQKRQWIMLKALPNAITAPKSSFAPFDIDKFFALVSAPEHMSTNLSLSDARALWSFYADRDQYKIDTFAVDSEFLYNPPLSEYGGAWVLVPRNNDYTPIHVRLEEKLGLRDPKPVETPATTK